jgi:hypothetical protein
MKEIIQKIIHFWRKRTHHIIKFPICWRKIIIKKENIFSRKRRRCCGNFWIKWIEWVVILPPYVCLGFAYSVLQSKIESYKLFPKQLWSLSRKLVYRSIGNLHISNLLKFFTYYLFNKKLQFLALCHDLGYHSQPSQYHLKLAE